MFLLPNRSIRSTEIRVLWKKAKYVVSANKEKVKGPPAWIEDVSAPLRSRWTIGIYSTLTGFSFARGAGMRRIFLVSPFFSLERHGRKGDRCRYRNCTFLSRRATARCVIFSHCRADLPAMRKDRRAGLRRETTGCSKFFLMGVSPFHIAGEYLSTLFENWLIISDHW